MLLIADLCECKLDRERLNQRLTVIWIALSHNELEWFWLWFAALFLEFSVDDALILRDIASAVLGLVSVSITFSRIKRLCTFLSTQTKRRSSEVR